MSVLQNALDGFVDLSKLSYNNDAVRSMVWSSHNYGNVEIMLATPNGRGVLARYVLWGLYDLILRMFDDKIFQDSRVTLTLSKRIVIGHIVVRKTPRGLRNSVDSGDNQTSSASITHNTVAPSNLTLPNLGSPKLSIEYVYHQELLSPPKFFIAAYTGILHLSQFLPEIHVGPFAALTPLADRCRVELADPVEGPRRRPPYITQEQAVWVLEEMVQHAVRGKNYHELEGRLRIDGAVVGRLGFRSMESPL